MKNPLYLDRVDGNLGELHVPQFVQKPSSANKDMDAVTTDMQCCTAAHGLVFVDLIRQCESIILNLLDV